MKTNKVLTRLGSWILSAAICALCAQSVNADEGTVSVEKPTAGKQVAQTLKKKITKELSLDYWLFLPQSYSAKSDKKWPVIVFLHGSGERGNNLGELERVKVHGPPMMVEKDPNFGFIVVSPQCKANSWWDWSLDELNAMLDKVLADVKNADPDRVYLTGLSMGGLGSFTWVMEYPERFAAVAPICGGGVYQTSEGLSSEKMQQLQNLPFWIFHGEDDHDVSVEQSKQMAAGLKAYGVKDVKLTTYPGVDHNSWTRTYANPELYKWFLQHRRGENAEK